VELLDRMPSFQASAWEFSVGGRGEERLDMKRSGILINFLRGVNRRIWSRALRVVRMKCHCFNCQNVF